MLFNSFDKEKLDTYLRELAKEFRRIHGKKMMAEIVLVGGAAILTNYGFRDMTTDIDAIIHASSSMKDAINIVGDKYELPKGWINSDFMRTSSYSSKLSAVSVYYKTFYGILTVRSISAVYLIAMKLRSYRKYKNDLSDMIGILAEHEKRENPISMEQINKAIDYLYGGWEDFSEDARIFINATVKNGSYAEIYESVKKEELISKDILVTFESRYPKVIRQSNVNDILSTLRAKREGILQK